MTVGRIPVIEGGIQPTLLDAKADLITATANDTPARLGVGANGTVLTADSAEATGLKWATPASGMTNPMTTTGDTIYSSSGTTPARLGIGSTGQVLTVSGGVPTWATAATGGMTLIATASPSGVSTYTFSSIPATYKHLLVVIQDLASSSASIQTEARFNGDTGGNYARNQIRTDASSNVSGSAGDTTSNSFRLGSIEASNSTATSRLKSTFWVYDYAGSKVKTAIGNSYAIGSQAFYSTYFGVWNNTSAITSLTIFDSNGPYNFTTGTILLYGVS